MTTTEDIEPTPCLAMRKATGLDARMHISTSCHDYDNTDGKMRCNRGIKKIEECPHRRAVEARDHRSLSSH